MDNTRENRLIVRACNKERGNGSSKTGYENEQRRKKKKIKKRMVRYWVICGLLVCTGDVEDWESGSLGQGCPTSNSWKEEDEIIINI